MTASPAATKRCVRCGVEKPLSEFYRDPKTGGPRGHCKACHKHTKPSEAKAEALRLLSQGLKQCTVCVQVKLLSEFKAKAAGRGGRTARCRRCLSRSPRRFARHEDLNALREIEQAGNRKCSQCGQVKPLEGFAPFGTPKDGSPRRRTRCKVCSGWKPKKPLRVRQVVTPKPKAIKPPRPPRLPNPFPNCKGKFTPNRARIEGDTGIIELTDRQDRTIAEAKVSAADLPRVLAAGRWHWNKRKRPVSGYVSRSFREPWTNKPGAEWLHRFILPPTPGLVIDHINGDGRDNRRENLRMVTYSQNLKNTHVHRKENAKP